MLSFENSRLAASSMISDQSPSHPQKEPEFHDLLVRDLPTLSPSIPHRCLHRGLFTALLWWRGFVLPSLLFDLEVPNEI